MAKSQHVKNSGWRKTQVVEFAALTSEWRIREALTPPPTSFGLLAPYYPPDDRESGAGIERYLAELYRHPIYKKLAADTNFAEARRLLSRKARSKKPGKYAEPLAEVRLFGIAALVVGTHANAPIFRPSLPTIGARRRALNRTTALLESLEGGIRLDDLLANASLTTSLKHLVRHLTFETGHTATAQKRKPREDDSYFQRYYLDGLIRLLRSAFGEASPSIVAAVAAMMGFSLDNSTIKRRTKAVAKLDAQTEERRRAIVTDRT